MNSTTEEVENIKRMVGNSRILRHLQLTGERLKKLMSSDEDMNKLPQMRYEYKYNKAKARLIDSRRLMDKIQAAFPQTLATDKETLSTCTITQMPRFANFQKDVAKIEKEFVESVHQRLIADWTSRVEYFEKQLEAKYCQLIEDDPRHECFEKLTNEIKKFKYDKESMYLVDIQAMQLQMYIELGDLKKQYYM